MLYTNQDAAELVAEHIDGALCPTNPTVLARINEAVRGLLQTDDTNFTIDQIRYLTLNNSISLPREYESVRLVTMNSYPVNVASQTIEYVASGPGRCSWEQLPKLIDEGVGHPTFFDIPKTEDWYLTAYSTQLSTTPLNISWRGRLADGSEILNTSGGSVNTLAISYWPVEGQMTASPTSVSLVPVRNLTGLSLPTGRTAYVTLYAYQPSTGRMCFLAKYAPGETVPGYRRYRLPRANFEDGILVECLAKKRFIPATSLSDVLLVQNIDAIKKKVISIERENVLDVNGSVAFDQLAQRELQKKQSNENRGMQFTIGFVGDMGSSPHIM